MTKKEITALRRPFIKELFRSNQLNLAMTIIAALLSAAAELVISWLIKEVADLISGECPYGFGTLLIIAGGAFALILLGGVLDRTFLSEFRAKAMKQYREYVFDRLMEKGIQAFSGENSSLYISALSNDVNAIETDFILNRGASIATTPRSAMTNSAFLKSAAASPSLPAGSQVATFDVS